LTGKLLYHLFVFFYGIGIRLAALWNPKAALWVKGRKKFPSIPDKVVLKQKKVWMHCASLGEFEQGRPLLEKIREQYPDIKIVLTFFSPSGYEVMRLYKGADYIFYLPMDGRNKAAKMIDAIQPSLVIWIKYEFWYFYITELKKRNIPLLMVSGLFRSGQPFFKWYGDIWRKMLQSFTYFFLQNETSKDLLQTVGISNNVIVSGDTRFDRVIEIAKNFEPLPYIEKFCGDHKVIVAGSTWEEDEEEWTHYVKNHPEIKFIFAPHEIDAENLKDVKKEFPGSIFYSELTKAIDSLKFNVEATINLQPSAINNQSSTTNDQLSTIHHSPLTTNMLIIDNIGMLSKLYHYADITFIGGGFGEDGIHNVLEAAVYGKPVLHGPEYEKFAEAVELVETGAGIPITNALELEKILDELWSNEALLKTKGEAAREYVYSKAGATEKIMNFIQEKRLLTN
jgi:3-deoxy-D-manno-octulosonic-acid transferase